MQDKGKEIFKRARFFILVLVILFVFLVLYLIISSNNSKRIKNNLKSMGYKEISNGTYSKEKQNSNVYLMYTYGLETKSFEKYSEANYDDYKEIISLKSSDDDIILSYQYKDIYGCVLTQRSSYSNNDFNCDIVSKTGSCSLKCDKLLKLSKGFKKEANKFYRDIK